MLAFFGDTLILETDTHCRSSYLQICFCVCYVFFGWWVVCSCWFVGLCFFLLFLEVFASFFSLSTYLLPPFFHSFLANRPKGKEHEQSTRELQEHKTGGQTFFGFDEANVDFCSSIIPPISSKNYITSKSHPFLESHLLFQKWSTGISNHLLKDAFLFYSEWKPGEAHRSIRSCEVTKLTGRHWISSLARYFQFVDFFHGEFWRSSLSGGSLHFSGYVHEKKREKLERFGPTKKIWHP